MIYADRSRAWPTSIVPEEQSSVVGMRNTTIPFPRKNPGVEFLSRWTIWETKVRSAWENHDPRNSFNEPRQDSSQEAGDL